MMNEMKRVLELAEELQAEVGRLNDKFAAFSTVFSGETPRAERAIKTRIVSKAKSTDRSEAMRKAWERRRANEKKVTTVKTHAKATKAAPAKKADGAVRNTARSEAMRKAWERRRANGKNGVVQAAAAQN